jgi:hypothetical protein
MAQHRGLDAPFVSGKSEGWYARYLSRAPSVSANPHDSAINVPESSNA